MSSRLESLNVPNVRTPRGTRKLTERPGSELWDVVSFHAYQRVRLNGRVGTLFTTDHITDAVRALTERYSKVVILSGRDRKSTRLNSSHVKISYAVFCLKKKKKPTRTKRNLHT